MKKADRQTAEIETLWSGVEDWTGLWEVVWRLQTLWPELRGEPAKREAQTLMLDLLSRGLIYLCLLEEPNKETPLSQHDAVKLMQRADAWDPPESDDHVWYVTTSEGEAEIERLHAAGVRVIWR